MDVLYGLLKAVDELCFEWLDLGDESLGKVDIYDSIAGTEESEHAFDEVLLVTRQCRPIIDVFAQV